MLKALRFGRRLIPSLRCYTTNENPHLSVIEEEYYEYNSKEEPKVEKTEKNVKPEVVTVEDVVKALNEQKGRELAVFSTSGMMFPYDYLVVCSTFNARQASSIAEHLRSLSNKLTAHAKTITRRSSGWYVCDLDSIQVHVMDEVCREKYELEKLWIGDESILDDSKDNDDDILIPHN